MEVALWAFAAYLAAGVVIAFATWLDSGAAAWTVGNWIAAITAGPVVVVELTVEYVRRARKERRDIERPAE